MKLHELQYTDGSRGKRKRVGRGEGSGWGKTPVLATKVNVQEVVRQEKHLVSKVDKHLYIAVFQNAVSTTGAALDIQSLI